MAKDEVVIKDRTFPISSYLKTTKLTEPIQEMMKSLYAGQSHTLKEWAVIDNSTNQRRCN